MSDVAERFRNVAAQFTVRVEAADGAWDNPSPCEGWVARDIIRHMVAWMPGYFLGAHGFEAPEIPSVDVDPAGAWTSLRDAIQSALDGSARTHEQATSDGMTLEQAVGAYGIGDVLIHTWDLARAAGLDDTLDAGEVHRAFQALNRPGEQVLQNGHFAPRVEVADDASEQTRLIALTGRRV